MRTLMWKQPPQPAPLTLTLPAGRWRNRWWCMGSEPVTESLSICPQGAKHLHEHCLFTVTKVSGLHGLQNPTQLYQNHQKIIIGQLCPICICVLGFKQILFPTKWILLKVLYINKLILLILMFYIHQHLQEKCKIVIMVQQ